MVMSLVLELEKPLLCSHLPLVTDDIHIHIYAARIVLLADLHIIKKTFALEVTRSYAGHIHEIQTLVLASEFLADLQIQVKGSVYLVLQE